MKTTIRKIGNSAGVILPATILKKLNLAESDAVEIEEDGTRILIRPCKAKPRYSLAELLSQCDESAPCPDELRDWEDAGAAGQELL